MRGSGGENNCPNEGESGLGQRCLVPLRFGRLGSYGALSVLPQDGADVGNRGGRVRDKIAKRPTLFPARLTQDRDAIGFKHNRQLGENRAAVMQTGHAPAWVNAAEPSWRRIAAPPFKPTPALRRRLVA